MGILDRIFGNLSEVQDLPNIKLGRFTDVYKTKEQKNAYRQAHILFDQENYLEAFKQFLLYLKDSFEDNIEFDEINDQIEFKIFQGSKCVEGLITNKIILAEAKIVQTTSFSIGYLRKMIASNYILNYCGYALDPDDAIVIQFHSSTIDSPPAKLYRALKELAVNADKQDDLLLNEFESLEPINQGHIKPIDYKEKEVKFQFLIVTIEQKLKLIEELKISPDKKPGAVSYVLLDLIYKLDYLTSPEGKTMEIFENLHRNYFSKSTSSSGRKNIELIKELSKLKEISMNNFFNELYYVSSTFGITPSTQLQNIINFINPEISYINWYIQNTQEKIAIAVCGYIIGSLLFNYSTPKPIHHLLHLYYEILEPDFFGIFDINLPLLNNKNGEFDKTRISAKIEDIQKSNKKDFAKCIIHYNILNYSSISKFCRSYILMIRGIELDLTDELAI